MHCRWQEESVVIRDEIVNLEAMIVDIKLPGDELPAWSQLPTSLPRPDLLRNYGVLRPWTKNPHIWSRVGNGPRHIQLCERPGMKTWRCLVVRWMVGSPAKGSWSSQWGCRSRSSGGPQALEVVATRLWRSGPSPEQPPRKRLIGQPMMTAPKIAQPRGREAARGLGLPYRTSGGKLSSYFPPSLRNFVHS